MKTEHLVAALAADTTPPAMRLSRALLIATATGGLVAALVLTFNLGIRGDFKQALGSWRFVAKFLVVAAFVLATARGALLLSRPEVKMRLAMTWLLFPAALALLLVFVELMSQPVASWSARAMGTNMRVCMTMIPILGLAPLVALLVAFRSGAPESPSALGGALGLLAGGIGAFFYAAHCTDDSPMFVALWYTFAVLIVGAIGAVAGRRVLAW